MKTNTKEKLILAMIQTDLTNSRLVFGLINLNIDSGAYSLDLKQSVLSFMGFKDAAGDFVSNYYELLMSQAVEVDMHNIRAMQLRAEQVFSLLQELKRMIQ